MTPAYDDPVSYDHDDPYESGWADEPDDDTPPTRDPEGKSDFWTAVFCILIAVVAASAGVVIASCLDGRPR